MANISLIYKTVADSSTLATSGGTTWSSSLPLTNMLDKRLSKTARATGLGTGTQTISFVIDLGAFSSTDMATFKEYDTISLIGHTLSPKATISILSSSDPTFATNIGLNLVSDKVYKIKLSALDYSWSHPKFLSNSISESDLVGFTRVYNYPFALYQDNSARGTASSNGRYLKITITDEYSESVRDYIDIGRLFIGKRFITGFNMLYGHGIKYIDPSISENTIGGELFSDVRPKKRSITFQHKLLTKNEALSGALEMQRISGTTEEVLVLTDYEDDSYSFRRDFLGHFTKLSPITQWVAQYYSTDFEIEEIL